MGGEVADVVEAALAEHVYQGHEGIDSDGEVAWLRCSCGWSLNFEMEYDDIRLAEARWDRHRAEGVAHYLAAASPAVVPDDDAAGGAAHG